MYKQLLFEYFGFQLTFHISYFVGVFPDSFTVKPEIHCHYVLVWFLGFLLVLVFFHYGLLNVICITRTTFFKQLFDFKLYAHGRVLN